MIPKLSRLILPLFAAITLSAADDPWAKVCEIKGGTDLRVFKKGSMQPVLAKMGDCTEESLIVAVKNEEVAIHKDQIDRVDYRPDKPRVTKETKNSMDTPETKPPANASPQNGTGPTTSSSTSFSIAGKPDFETIYRRPAPNPQKK